MCKIRREWGEVGDCNCWRDGFDHEPFDYDKTCVTLSGFNLMLIAQEPLRLIGQTKCSKSTPPTNMDMMVGPQLLIFDNQNAMRF